MRWAQLATLGVAGLGLAVPLVYGAESLAVGVVSDAPTAHWMCGMPRLLTRSVDASLPSGCDALPRRVDRTDVVLDALAGRFLVQGEPFSGVAELHDDAGTLRQREQFVGGRRHGLYEKFDAAGTLRTRMPYRDGRIHGMVQTWWASGQRRSAAMVRDGVSQGRHRQWYRSGALFKQMNIVDGREQGLQTAWRENGSIYANYEVRNGRTYGLRRAQPCIQLTEEALR